jgi:hypothetical protein
MYGIADLYTIRWAHISHLLYWMWSNACSNANVMPFYLETRSNSHNMFHVVVVIVVVVVVVVVRRLLHQVDGWVTFR